MIDRLHTPLDVGIKVPLNGQPTRQFGSSAETRMAVLISSRPDARRGGTADFDGTERRAEAGGCATRPESRERKARSSLEGKFNISAIAPPGASPPRQRYFKYELSFC
jgi:hypothetical protein